MENKLRINNKIKNVEFINLFVINKYLLYKAIMKTIKYFLGWILVWQIVTLFFKDKKLTDKIYWAWNLFDWFKILFNEIVDLNKNIFIETKKINFEKNYFEIKEFILKEKEKIEESINQIKSQLWELNENQFKPLVEKVEANYEEYKKKIIEKYDYLKDRVDFDEICDIINHKIKSLKENFKEKLE